MSHQVCVFVTSLKIKLFSSPPYYAQANSQVESSNKTLIKLIKKKSQEKIVSSRRPCLQDDFAYRV
jgi:hypothetical protein